MYATILVIFAPISIFRTPFLNDALIFSPLRLSPNVKLLLKDEPLGSVRKTFAFSSSTIECFYLS